MRLCTSHMHAKAHTQQTHTAHTQQTHTAHTHNKHTQHTHGYNVLMIVYTV